MNAPTIELLVSLVPTSMGSFGPLLHEIETVLQSPSCNLSTIGDSIEKDPMLTARLLQFANSPFCGFSTRLATVTEAISLIGIQQVQDLITASSVLEKFEGVPEEYIRLNDFWLHSLACGVAARLLARERRLAKPDKFFVIGLLHDVGRLVLFSHAPRAAKQVFELYRKEPMLLTQAETRVLGFDHQHLAAALLENWKYPPSLIQAVAHHHNPTHCREANLEACVVHVADHLVHALQMGSSGERFVPPLDAQAWETLGLTTDALATVVAGVEDQIDAVRELFLTNA